MESLFFFRYSPPLIWGRNGHIQTAAYGLLGHASLKRTYDKRHVIELSDNSSVLFDVFEPINTHPSGGFSFSLFCLNF